MEEEAELLRKVERRRFMAEESWEMGAGRKRYQNAGRICTNYGKANPVSAVSKEGMTLVKLSCGLSCGPEKEDVEALRVFRQGCCASSQVESGRLFWTLLVQGMGYFSEEKTHRFISGARNGSGSRCGVKFVYDSL